MSPYSIDYSDLRSHMCTSATEGLAVDATLQKPAWGHFAERCLDLNHLKVYGLTAHFNKPFSIRYHEAHMPQMVHLCLDLDGEIEVAFRNLRTSLTAERHHGLYIDDTEYLINIQKVKVVHIEIDTQYFLDLLGDSEAWSANLKKKIDQGEMVMSGVGYVDMPMKQTIHNLLQAPMQGTLQKLLVEAKVLELLAMQLGQFSKPQRQDSRKENKEIYYAVRAHLDNTFQQEHSLNGLARQFGINEFKLKKGFRETFNTTVFTYLFDRRMDHARQLLLDSQVNVSEVSRKVGYKNANHFSTAFKNKFGVSPASLKN